MGLESESGEVTIPVEESTGEIKIANDVVATIAALAATETKRCCISVWLTDT